jgi:hypothetical protein
VFAFSQRVFELQTPAVEVSRRVERVIKAAVALASRDEQHHDPHDDGDRGGEPDLRRR